MKYFATISVPDTQCRWKSTQLNEGNRANPSTGGRKWVLLWNKVSAGVLGAGREVQRGPDPPKYKLGHISNTVQTDHRISHEFVSLGTQRKVAPAGTQSSSQCKTLKRTLQVLMHNCFSWKVAVFATCLDICLISIISSHWISMWMSVREQRRVWLLIWVSRSPSLSADWILRFGKDSADVSGVYGFPAIWKVRFPPSPCIKMRKGYPACVSTSSFPETVSISWMMWTLVCEEPHPNRQLISYQAMQRSCTVSPRWKNAFQLLWTWIWNSDLPIYLMQETNALKLICQKAWWDALPCLGEARHFSCGWEIYQLRQSSDRKMSWEQR